MKRLPIVLLAAVACDRGPAAGEVQIPAVSGTTQSADAAIASDPVSSDVLLAWVAGDGKQWHIYFARTDTGDAWSTPTRVTNVDGDVHPHGESSPRIIAAPGVIGVTWVNSVPAPGRRWPGSNVRFSRSVDGGRSWSAAITLNDDTADGTPRGHIFHGAAWRGDSGLVVAWMDERGGAAVENVAAESHSGHHQEQSEEPDATVYLASSGDLGGSWSANRPLWGAACPCCRVALARNPRGDVLAAWRKHFPGNVRDIVVSPITETGSAIRVHTDNWEYPGCPHTGPGASADSSGSLHVTWFSGKPGAAGVYYARSTDSGFTMPVALVSGRVLPTAHPRVAALPDGGALVAWDISETGPSSLHVARISNTGKLSSMKEIAGTTGADHPEIALFPDGRALIAWTEKSEGKSRVRLIRY